MVTSEGKADIIDSLKLIRPSCQGPVTPGLTPPNRPAGELCYTSLHLHYRQSKPLMQSTSFFFRCFIGPRLLSDRRVNR